MITKRISIFFCCVSIFVITLLGISGCNSTLENRTSEILELEGDIGVHDPVIIRQGDTYYVFCTGRGGGGIIPIRTSKDLRHWTLSGSVFRQLPAWVSEEGIRARDAWAPDISFYNGKYHLYYAVSTFGSQNSAIGLATNLTLDPNSPDYKWIDQGMVVRSTNEVDWNAIDGNLVVEDEKNVWLCWGSFWGGIKMRRINPETGKLSDEDTTLYSLASRERAQPVNGAIEAPFIIKHGKYWYLFVSFDRCCQGVRSTYKIMVGRSREVTGPYFDKEGKPMTEGGGSLVLQAAENAAKWAGPGHEAVLHEQDGDYLVFHAYSIPDRGRSMLNIATIVWEDDWPCVAPLE
jgi:arabinan endo-1,5-alpha-L-arabinosidase